jgi:hypothetical protein
MNSFAQKIPRKSIDSTDSDQRNNLGNVRTKVVDLLNRQGLSSVALFACTCLVPISPLLEHVGITIFGTELEKFPAWWKLLSDPCELSKLCFELEETSHGRR